MPKKTKKELIEHILVALDHKKNTVNEIAQDIGSNWGTVKDTLDFLEKYEIVTKQVDTGISQYYRKQEPRTHEGADRITYFNLPLSQKQKELTHSLFGIIQRKYLAIKGKKPGKLFVQKVVEDIETESNLGIPGGWYLYGLSSVVHYAPETDYIVNEELFDSNLMSDINAVFEEYIGIKSTENIMFHQYKKFDNKLYLTKLNLSKISNPRLDLQKNEMKQSLQRYLSNFLLYLPKGKFSEEAQEVTSKYVIAMNKLLLGAENLNKIKHELDMVFCSIWKYVATVQLYNDLLKFYTKPELASVGKKIVLAKEDALEQVEFISEYYIPPKKPPVLKISSEDAELVRDIFIDLTKDQV